MSAMRASPLPDANTVSVQLPIIVTVVVVTWNSAPALPALLASLSSGMAQIPTWELTAVDNNSTDDTRIILDASPLVSRTIHMRHNAGYAAAINAGICNSQPSEAYLILNPDTQLTPGSARRLLDGLNPPQIGATVPLLINEHGETFPSLRREPTIRRRLGDAFIGGTIAGRSSQFGEMVVSGKQYRSPQIIDWATGAAMMIAAHCSATVGPWDETFFLYSEETDFSLRAADRGISIQFRPEAVVIHTGGELHSSPSLYQLMLRNRIQLYRRRHNASLGAGYWSACLLYELARFNHPIHRSAAISLICPPSAPAGSSLTQAMP